MKSDITTGQRAGTPAILEGLAMQARTFAGNAANNLLQLGRVFAEAKPLVAHGQWEDWLEKNSGMTTRQAQNCMAAWNRFGGKDQYAALGQSKLFALLSLPDGKEDDFARQEDLEAMTARQVKEAVRKAREEMETDLERERRARRQAEKRAEDAENRPAEIPEEVRRELEEKDAELEAQRKRMGELAEEAEEAADERDRMGRALTASHREKAELEEMLKDSQAGYDAMQQQMLEAKSALARGDAERTVSETVTAAEFMAAVRSFIGTVAEIPFMSRAFSSMHPEEREQYRAGLATVQDWARRAETAIETIGGDIIGL